MVRDVTLDTTVTGRYSHRVVVLREDEAKDLVRTILEAVEAAEQGRPIPRQSWAAEALDWRELIVDRLNE